MEIFFLLILNFLLALTSTAPGAPYMKENFRMRAHAHVRLHALLCVASLSTLIQSYSILSVCNKKFIVGFCMSIAH